MSNICFKCGTPFSCGVVDKSLECWCVSMPTATVEKSVLSCLCPSCLPQAIEMKNLRDITWRLWLSYHGGNYSGFQRQENAPSIQAELELALKKLTNQEISICVAGRTDAGVHAHAQAVSCRFTSLFDSRKLVLALSSQLPSDIRVWRADEMPHGFNARSHSVGKCYKYTIDTALTSNAFFGTTRWNLRRRLNILRMQEAADFLIGDHDFESFRSTGCSAAHAKRYIWHFGVSQRDNIVELEIRGNAFCYNMVRIFVGTIVDVGLEKLEVEQVSAILQARDRRLAGQTAPAQGLSFSEVYFPDNLTHAGIPSTAQFPRFPVSINSWPFSEDSIRLGPWRS